MLIGRHCNSVPSPPRSVDFAAVPPKPDFAFVLLHLRPLPVLLASFAAAVAHSGPLAGPVVEDPAARAALPELHIIPAATANELTPAVGNEPPDAYRTWTVSHGDAGSRRYSALDQINRRNVRRLEIAWQYRSSDGSENRANWRGVQANPIIVDGVMFAPTADRAIVALDARNGRELWKYQVETPPHIGLQDAPARRGLVYWPGNDDHKARVVFASGNWVYALDPATGRPLPEFGENGRTPLPTGGTAVGVIWESSYIVPGLTGDLYSYDLRDGRLQWRFHTIPREGEFGSETWQGAARSGANPWGGVALDDRRGIVYVAVGAPRPDFVGVERHGDNLFANCLVAIDARTGQRLWHFQNTRHDIWDLDFPAPPNLVTVQRDEFAVDAVAIVSKTGHTFVFHRVTGRPLFPIRMRRAPTSKLPGEVTAPYQPDPELPEPFARLEFARDDITDRTPEARAYIEHLLGRANMGWYEPFELGKPTAFFGIHGGAEWTGAAIDVPTGRLYVSSNHIPWTITVFRDDDPPPLRPATVGERAYVQWCGACHGPDRRGIGTSPPLRGLRHAHTDESLTQLVLNGRNAMPPLPMIPEPERLALFDFLFARDRGPAAEMPRDDAVPRYSFSGYRKLLDAEDYPGSKPPWGTLNCLDLNTGRILWRVPLGEYPELTAQGVPVTGTENFGGPMVTAGGLVFVAGTRDEKIRAFDQDTGEELWSAKLPFGGYAPPATYEVDGRQYVVIAATGAGKLGTTAGNAWVAFALPENP